MPDPPEPFVSTATRLAGQIAAVSPYLLCPKLCKLVGTAKPAGVGDNVRLVDWFAGGATPYDDKEWVIDAKSGVTLPQFARDKD